MDERRPAGMSNQASAFALRNALGEIKNVCPDVTNTFIFRANGEVVAQDQNTPQIAINNVQESFRNLTEKSNVLGDLESVSFKGQKARANITRFQDFYIANVASNEVDEKTVTNLTRIMIPTMLRLVEQMYPSQGNAKEPLPTPELKPQRISSPEIYAPKPSELKRVPFTVENFGFGSFLKDSDIVLLDTALIAQWNETFGNDQITKISVENPLTHKCVVCQFKPFKESKFEGKGIVQLSDKIQTELGIKKGAKILIKPISDPTEIETSTSNQPDKIIIPEAKPTAQKPESFGGRQGHFSTPNIPVNQFIVENAGGMGGLLGGNDFARVDTGILVQWQELFGDKKIEQITIEETVAGRKLVCKFKPMKGSDLEGKGIIQLPEKIQQALQIKKGALVVVKPVVEE